MVGLGTLINVALIIAGGAVGLVAGRLVKPCVQEGLLKATGVAVLFIGLSGALEGMLSVSDGALVSGGTVVVVASLALGTLAGELLDIASWFERLGAWLRRVSGNEKNERFLDAFLTATFTVCIGAMAASMGVGCLFSALPVGVLQGAITLLARALQPLMTEAALANLSTVGSILIFCVGVNLIRGRTFNTANMLPAVVVAVLMALA